MAATDRTMSTHADTPTDDGQVREKAAEYDVGAETMVMIEDPENEYAWVYSNDAVSLEEMR